MIITSLLWTFSNVQQQNINNTVLTQQADPRRLYEARVNINSVFLVFSVWTVEELPVYKAEAHHHINAHAVLFQHRHLETISNY